MQKKYIPFRDKASFGKRIEYWIIGNMLKEGLDVYIPMVDDFGVDAVIRKPNGTFIEIQIKARSKEVIFGDAALFAAISHKDIRKNYYFVFYSERMDCSWIMSSKEFVKEAAQNKSGKNKGSRSIWFNGRKTKDNLEFCKPQFEKYLATNFNRFK